MEEYLLDSHEMLAQVCVNEKHKKRREESEIQNTHDRIICFKLIFSEVYGSCSMPWVTKNFV